MNGLPKIEHNWNLVEHDGITRKDLYFGLDKEALKNDKIIWGIDYSYHYFVSFFDESEAQTVTIFQAESELKWVRVSKGQQNMVKTNFNFSEIAAELKAALIKQQLALEAQQKPHQQPKSALLLGQKVDMTNPDLEVFIAQCANMGVDFSKIPKLSVNLKHAIGVHYTNQVTLEDFIDTNIIWGLDGDKNFFVSYLFQENGQQVVKTIHQDPSYEPMQWRRQFGKDQPVCSGWSKKVQDINQVINELSTIVPASSKKLKK